MSQSRPENGNTPNDAENNNEYFYTVLNLPRTASDHDIRERYMHLSVIFHPDKQLDESRVETATKNFLEIQKAYEVLSDPVRREAYDLMGLKGLQLLRNIDAQALSRDEVRAQLLEIKRREHEMHVDELITPRGRVSLGLDASSLLYKTGTRVSLYEEPKGRLSGVGRSGFAVQHSLAKQVRQGTSVSMLARLSAGRDPDRRSGGAFWGTVRHQFSPRFECQATTSLLRFGTLKLGGNYRHEDYTVASHITFRPSIIDIIHHVYNHPSHAGKVLPSSIPVTLAFSRRLFPTSNAQGLFSFSTTSQFVDMQLSYLSDPYPFDLSAEADELSHATLSERSLHLPSRSGLVGERYWRVGMGIRGALPSLNAQYVLNFSELNIQLRNLVELGLLGVAVVVGAGWTSEDTSSNVSADVELSAGGVALELNFSYLHQHFHMPIALSHEYDPALAFWTALMPSTAFVLAYHFVFKPRNRRRRLDFLRQARRELKEAKPEILRQHEETVYLLRDTARRHTQAEASIDGLVILEAWYGPEEQVEGFESLDLNVTIPIQVLVRKSQLYIPGRRSKAGLQGFYDPVPGVPKSLRIRYTFRGREHYAETPDYLPVVLPLEEHLVQ
ncbi:unnamed protein product [Somion occarium]|uniref:J domain-containing protein n=1 Tax=Somion occarium TaxID=3059160 RepID=A0ABP1DQ10_9APHY